MQGSSVAKVSGRCFAIDVPFLRVLLTGEAAKDGEGRVESQESKPYSTCRLSTSASAHAPIFVFIAEANISPRFVRASTKTTVL